eukprot:749_1
MAGFMDYELDFAKCKKVQVKIRDAVFGFVREVENKLIDKQTIPDLIHHICLLYYFESDEWDFETIGDALTLCDNLLTIKHGQAKSGHGALLKNIVNHGKHHWKFQINNITSTGFNGIIGVFALYPETERDVSGVINYSLSHAICVETGQYFTFFGNMPTDYAAPCKEGNIVEMICDMNDGVLKYIVNDIDYGIAATLDSNIEYRAGIYMYLSNDSVTLLK